MEAQYFLLICQISTGIVMMPDGKQFFLEGKDDPYIPFESLEQAVERAESVVNDNSALEAALFNSEKSYVKSFRANSIADD